MLGQINMGYYIETPEPTNKAEQLHRLYGAELVLSPESFDFAGDDALICVVENEFFDAAAVAYNSSERDDFMRPNGRERTWLKLPKATVVKLCPQVQRRLYEPPHGPTHEYAL